MCQNNVPYGPLHMPDHGGPEDVRDDRRPPAGALDQQRRFITDASHELCTPVAGLRAQLEEARMHPGQTDLISLLDCALRDVDRLHWIVNDLLLLARLHAGLHVELEPVDLAELVRAQIRSRTDRHPVALRLEPGVTIHAVPIQLARLFTSLLDNAQRHARSMVQIQVRLDGPVAELTVADDGHGISEEDGERVFEPFSRLDSARSRDQGGSGLGLTIARDIAGSHGGTLIVEAASCGGASLVLRLPSKR
jgi:signal transduction histidine kinase